jgi:CBS domain containing-hemolysin-like protein
MGAGAAADCETGGVVPLLQSAMVGTIYRGGGFEVSDGSSVNAIDAWRLGVVLALVLVNGFFVAAEFALVGVRRSRIQQLVKDGDAGARRVDRALGEIDRYVSATQLGITVASLALGWIGEPAVAAVVDRGLVRLGLHPSAAIDHSTAAVATAFIVITFLHIILGELAPKSLALLRPERVSRALIGPLHLFARLTSPMIWLLNGAASLVLRTVGVRTAHEHSHVHTADELRLLVMQARAQGELDEADTAMLAGVFDFHDKKAQDVMCPRTEVVALSIDASEVEVRALLLEQRYSRYPVYRGTLDDIVGVFLAKDLWLRGPRPAGETFALAHYVREALFVPSSRRAERVMEDLRRTRAHMAVVLDEYGGTAGMITMEDLVEEVIGDIADEHDPAERFAVELDGILELAGTMSLIDVRSDYHLDIPDGDWTTLGGYVFARLGHVPRIGERAPYPGGELEVVAMDARRVAALRVHREQPAAVVR